MQEENLMCRVGVAQRLITPPLNSNLSGYFHRRVGKEVRSDLYTKAMVIESRGQRIALVANDLVGSNKEFTRPTKNRIAETCGLPPEAVMISATHTHTAPAVVMPKTGPYEAVPGYLDTLVEAITGVVEDAANAMFDATLHVGHTEADGYSRNKLRRLKSGEDVYAMAADVGEGEIIGPGGPLDTSVQVLCARDQGKRIRAFVVNFACHPNSGPEVIWAEWPGELARVIGAVYGEEVPCLLLQGTAGDVDCLTTISREQVGRGIAGAAIMAAERESDPIAPVTLDCRLRVLKIPRLSKTPDTDRMLEELKRKPKLTYLEEGWVRSYENWDPEPAEVDTPVQCLRIGSTAVVGLPAEIFTAIGLEIKRYSPAEHTLVVELANERASGYIPPVEQANRGGYGEWPFISRHLIAEAGSLIADAAIELLHEMWDTSSNA